jgi:hypothetical protein
MDNGLFSDDVNKRLRGFGWIDDPTLEQPYDLNAFDEEQFPDFFAEYSLFPIDAPQLGTSELDAPTEDWLSFGENQGQNRKRM